MKRVCKIFIFILFLAAAAFLAAAYKEDRPYAKAKEEQIELQNLVLPQKNTEEDKEEFEERSIDFEALRKVNPDIAAWLSIPGTQIDYPVLIGKDDKEYLEKNFKGEYSSLGSLFAFSDTNRDFSDAHSCIFAHNMKKPQMFGELKRYKDEEFAKEQGTLYLYTPGRVEKYQLFSVFECGKEDEIFAHKMEKHSEEFEKLVVELVYRSTLEEKKEIYGNFGKVLTLSTCSEYDRTNQRLTVHFMKIELIEEK